MPVTVYKASSPDLELAKVDLLTYIFSNPLSVPDSKPLYIDAISNKTRTFGDVKQRTSSLTKALQDLGVKEGDVVTFFSPNSIDYAINCYAIIGCGATVSPVSSALNPTELRHQLATAESKVIIAHSSLLATARAAAKGTHVERVLQADGEEDDSGNNTTETLATNTPPGKLVTIPADRLSTHIAFICFSSGTTGAAKGVITTHTNIVANVQQWNAHFVRDLDHNAPLIAFLPMSHIYSLNLHLCTFVHVTTTMIVMSKFDLDVYLTAIQRYKVKDLILVPPVLLALAKDPRVQKYDISSLESIMSGAAPVSVALMQSLENQFKKRYGKTLHCFEAWGMTETSPIGIGMPMAMHAEKRHQGIGTILPNVQCRLVDAETGKDVAPPASRKTGSGSFTTSEVGELYISGPNVCAGYYRNDKATKDSFSIDDEGRRWFMTGDIATIDSDGIVKIHDRSKEMFKYKGSQVTPAELEGILVNCPVVSDACVVGIYAEEQATDLPLAFIALNTSAKQKQRKEIEAEIHVWVNERVASYKRLRGGIRFVDEIPKSPSGKILRRVLRDSLLKEGQEGKRSAKL